MTACIKHPTGCLCTVLGDDEDTNPGIRTTVGPIAALRHPALNLAMAKRGRVMIPLGIPPEWGVPELILVAK